MLEVQTISGCEREAGTWISSPANKNCDCSSQVVPQAKLRALGQVCAWKQEQQDSWCGNSELCTMHRSLQSSVHALWLWSWYHRARWLHHHSQMEGLSPFKHQLCANFKSTLYFLHIFVVSQNTIFLLADGMHGLPEPS